MKLVLYGIFLAVLVSVNIGHGEGTSPKKDGTSSTFGSSKIIVGIFAMAEKKEKSASMKKMMQYLLEYYGNEMEIRRFPQETFNKPVEEWPIVQALMPLYSDGFPIKKVQDYVKLRKPFVLNDLGHQRELLDRAKVYSLLAEWGIPVPRHVVMRRGHGSTDSLTESDNYIIVNGEKFIKPFVEKPVSTEQHDIYVYLPNGRGRKELFRKKEDVSNRHSIENNVRRDGSYIYEDYIPTDGSEIKVYAVGPKYAFAESRKSPTSDGAVVRDRDGTEHRQPTNLKDQEKEYAKKIVTNFGQTVCGFDMLRGKDGKSYVIDVNGFSFVKSTDEYYQETANILGDIILQNTKSGRSNSASARALGKLKSFKQIHQ